MTSGTLAATACFVVAAFALAAIWLIVVLYRRLAELEAERERARSGPLIGRLAVVNTPKPDDQALRGVVTRELEDGGVVLAAAVYLERESVRGGGETVREVPAGDVVVSRVAWAQLLNPTQEG